MEKLFETLELAVMAFQKKIDEAKIPDSTILLVQDRYLQPTLTSNFYADVCARKDYYRADAELFDRMRLVVAYFVKYHVLPEVHLQIGQGGMGAASGRGRQNVGFEGLSVAMDEALRLANMYNQLLTDYLNKNELLYPLYSKGKNPCNAIVFAGGIIINKKIEDECD